MRLASCKHCYSPHTPKPTQAPSTPLASWNKVPYETSTGFIILKHASSAFLHMLCASLFLLLVSFPSFRNSAPKSVATLTGARFCIVHVVKIFCIATLICLGDFSAFFYHTRLNFPKKIFLTAPEFNYSLSFLTSPSFLSFCSLHYKCFQDSGGFHDADLITQSSYAYIVASHFVLCRRSTGFEEARKKRLPCVSECL